VVEFTYEIEPGLIVNTAELRGRAEAVGLNLDMVRRRYLKGKRGPALFEPKMTRQQAGQRSALLARSRP